MVHLSSIVSAPLHIHHVYHVFKPYDSLTCNEHSDKRIIGTGYRLGHCLQGRRLALNNPSLHHVHLALFVLGRPKPSPPRKICITLAFIYDYISVFLM